MTKAKETVRSRSSGLVAIDGETLKIEDVVAVARAGAEVVIPEKVGRRVEENQKVVEKLVREGKVVYGVTTGFGKLANVPVSKAESEDLQRNILYSHAAGVGDPFDDDVVRAAMVLRANTIGKGHSGIRIGTMRLLVEMLNKDITPVVYEKGSLGASGDLAPLAQMAGAMIGVGSARHGGRTMSAMDALRTAGLEPATLTHKEGLGLTNGTQVMAGIGCLLVHDAENLLKCAEIAAAMTCESLGGMTDPFDERIQDIRPYAGQKRTAAHLRKLLQGSKLTTRSGKSENVQDPYSLRCLPQILSPIHDGLSFIRSQLAIEINSSSDNPLIFTMDGDASSGGNFHGQALAVSLDEMGILMSIVANLSERHINRLLNPRLSGLPPFLTGAKEGLNSGMMVVQYSAAALVSENKVLSHPACVDSIPVSADQEDFVSMGMGSALKARQILRNATSVVAIHLMTAAQAVDMKGPDKMAPATKAAHDVIRKAVAHLAEDRVMHSDIKAMEAIVKDGSIMKAVESKVGTLE